MHRYAPLIALILFAGCGPTAKERAAEAFAQGRLHLHDGDIQEAIACYDLAIELDPGNAEVYVRRAETRFTLGDPDGARADFEKAIRLDPDMADAYKGRATVLVVLTDFEAALADLDKAIQLDPSDPASYRARWQIHSAKRDRAKAEADWVTATQLEYPDHLVGKVVSVADGDNLTVLVGQKEVKVRVHGIDCPENGQPFATEANQFTTDRAFGTAVSVKPLETDQDGRTVGRVTLSAGGDLSELLVAHGLAWHHVKSAPDDEKLATIEAEARKTKRGLWSDSEPPIPPWEWQNPERGENQPGDQTGC